MILSRASAGLEEPKSAHRVLHEPTVDLRRGQASQYCRSVDVLSSLRSHNLRTHNDRAHMLLHDLQPEPVAQRVNCPGRPRRTDLRRCARRQRVDLARRRTVAASYVAPPEPPRPLTRLFGTAPAPARAKKARSRAWTRISIVKGTRAPARRRCCAARSRVPARLERAGASRGPCSSLLARDRVGNGCTVGWGGGRCRTAACEGRAESQARARACLAEVEWRSTRARGDPSPVRGSGIRVKVCIGRVIGRWDSEVRVMGACVRVRIGRGRGRLCAG